MLDKLYPDATDEFSLPPLSLGGFVDFHFNGDKPARGKTRYGLVLDLAKSTYRWNLNFEVLPHETLAKAMNDTALSVGERNLVERMFTTYLSGMQHNPNIFLAAALRNKRPGKKEYALEYDFRVAAILDVSKGVDDPTAVLFYGNQTYCLDGVEWRVPASANHTIKVRYDLD